ncbi:MAG: hypothetical protein JW395_4185 [Nitrospira sp.]|nr:hypothetical protein [Nitrospira sp.]
MAVLRLIILLTAQAAALLLTTADFLGLLPPWMNIWQAGFMAFVLATILTEAFLLVEWNAARDELPEIDAWTHPDVISQGVGGEPFRTAALVVQNNGAPGKFRIQVQLVNSDDRSHLERVYLAVWDDTDGQEEITILSGHYEIATIAHLLFWNSDLGTERRVGSLLSHGKFVDGGEDVYLEFYVTVSTDPKPKGGPFYREFKLSLGGLEDITPIPWYSRLIHKFRIRQTASS